MHNEDDLSPISALQHLLFCERQTALIHIERLWVENRFTAEGRILHRIADAAKSETRDGVRITRGLPVHSFELGLYGICDVVNFKPPDLSTQKKLSLPKRIKAELAQLARPDVDAADTDTTRTNSERTKCDNEKKKSLPNPFAHWTITPVEYKRGKPKSNDCDRVQLCAQAMALEEMLGPKIEKGELFYGKQKRRIEVTFDATLRARTAETTRRLHELIHSQHTPTAIREKKCESCSLLSVCLPPTSRQKTVSAYLRSMIND